MTERSPGSSRRPRGNRNEIAPITPRLPRIGTAAAVNPAGNGMSGNSSQRASSPSRKIGSPVRTAAPVGVRSSRSNRLHSRAVRSSSPAVPTISSSSPDSACRTAATVSAPMRSRLRSRMISVTSACVAAPERAPTSCSIPPRPRRHATRSATSRTMHATAWTPATVERGRRLTVNRCASPASSSVPSAMSSAVTPVSNAWRTAASGIHGSTACSDRPSCAASSVPTNSHSAALARMTFRSPSSRSTPTGTLSTTASRRKAATWDVSGGTVFTRTPGTSPAGS